jgi:hypothetical protein
MRIYRERLITAQFPLISSRWITLTHFTFEHYKGFIHYKHHRPLARLSRSNHDNIFVHSKQLSHSAMIHTRARADKFVVCRETHRAINEDEVLSLSLVENKELFNMCRVCNSSSGGYF